MKTFLVALVFNGLAPVAGPQTAGDVTLQGFGKEVATGQDLDDAARLQVPPSFAVTFGGLQITLEDTTLAEIANRFGGTIHQRGGVGDASAWLCYRTVQGRTPHTIWFLSGPMGGPEQAVLGVVEAIGEDAQKGCAAPRGGLAKLTIGIPAIGSTRAEVMERFGVSNPRTLYSLTKDTADADLTRTVVYKLYADVVTAVSISQVTTN